MSCKIVCPHFNEFKNMMKCWETFMPAERQIFSVFDGMIDFSFRVLNGYII